MPSVDEMFPSKWLSAADLQGKRIPVTIAACNYEKVGDEMKYVLFFHGKQKGLVLNKTNADAIAAILGNEQTEGWVNGQILLSPEMVLAFGKQQLAIRIAAPPNSVPRPQMPEPAPLPDAGPDADIPF